MGKDSLPIFMLIALLAVFWLLVLRPARRQQQQTQRVQAALAVGDKVVLSSGIFGVIESLDDARVRLEVAPGTVISVARQVVVRRVEPETEPETEPDTGPENSPPADTADQHDVNEKD